MNDPQNNRVFIIKDMYYDQIYYYDRKDQNPQDFADNKWPQQDAELFADPIDILDANNLTSEFNTILHKRFKTYPYSNKSCALSSLSDIPDSVGEE